MYRFLFLAVIPPSSVAPLLPPALAFIASHFEYHFVVYYFRGRPMLILKQPFRQPSTHDPQSLGSSVESAPSIASLASIPINSPLPIPVRVPVPFPSRSDCIYWAISRRLPAIMAVSVAQGLSRFWQPAPFSAGRTAAGHTHPIQSQRFSLFMPRNPRIAGRQQTPASSQQPGISSSRWALKIN